MGNKKIWMVLLLIFLMTTAFAQQFSAFYFPSSYDGTCNKYFIVNMRWLFLIFANGMTATEFFRNDLTAALFGQNIFLIFSVECSRLIVGTTEIYKTHLNQRNGIVGTATSSYQWIFKVYSKDFSL